MSKCIYQGRVGNLKTWCRHPDMPATVSTGYCDTCSLSESKPLPKLPICSHRGEQIASIQSGCGACKGKPVYTCDVHRLCVETQRQREEVKGARACEKCEDYMIDVIHFQYQKNTNQDASIEVLHNAGMTGLCVDAPDVDALDLIRRAKPRIVINRAMCLSIETVREIIETTDCKVITTCHSVPSHLLLVDDWTHRWCQFWELSRTLDRCYIGGPIKQSPWDTPRYAYIPNVIPEIENQHHRQLKKDQKIAEVLIAGRRDIIKNMPNQLHALSVLYDRGYSVRANICVKSGADGLATLCKSLGLPYRVQEWLPFTEFKAWVRDTIDVGMCVSYSETFCYVATDCMGYGIPVVGSHCVPVVPSAWRCHPDDIEGIADTVARVLTDYGDASQHAIDCYESIRLANAADYQAALGQ